MKKNFIAIIMATTLLFMFSGCFSLLGIAFSGIDESSENKNSLAATDDIEDGYEDDGTGIALPEGTIAKLDDMKFEGKNIVYAKLSSPRKINTPLGKIRVSDEVEFFPSGAVKGIVLDQDVNITGGVIYVPKNGKTRVYFYESGSLDFVVEQVNSFKSAETIASITTRIGRIDVEGMIKFYDSGKSDVVQPKMLDKIYLDEFRRREKKEISFFKNGQLAKDEFAASKSFNTSIGKIISTDNSTIAYYSDGSLASVVTSNAIVTEVLGQNVVIPANTTISFHKNGKLKYFETNTDMTVTVGKTLYTPKCDRDIMGLGISEDGNTVRQIRTGEVKTSNIHLFEEYYYKNKANFLITKFYDDGTPAEILSDKEIYFIPPSKKFLLRYSNFKKYDGYDKYINIFDELLWDGEITQIKADFLGRAAAYDGNQFAVVSKPGFVHSVVFDKNEKIDGVYYYKTDDRDFMVKYASRDYRIITDDEFEPLVEFVKHQ